MSEEVFMYLMFTLLPMDFQKYLHEPKRMWSKLTWRCFMTWQTNMRRRHRAYRCQTSSPKLKQGFSTLSAVLKCAREARCLRSTGPSTGSFFSRSHDKVVIFVRKPFFYIPREFGHLFVEEALEINTYFWECQQAIISFVRRQEIEIDAVKKGLFNFQSHKHLQWNQ